MNDIAKALARILQPSSSSASLLREDGPSPDPLPLQRGAATGEGWTVNLTRRRLLGGMSALAVAGPVAARTYIGEVPWAPNAALPPQGADDTAPFLTPSERAFVTAAVDRLIPEDEFPSASQLGVVDFIDRQLAGAYGRGDIYYMQGPFEDGLPTQGYQAEAPALLYRQAIEDIEAWLGEPFADLAPERQDEALTALSEDEAELEHVEPKTFFELLWQNTKEGYFGDPLYGGNRDMAAWRMIGFPGARYDYRPWIAHGGEPVVLEPVSVGGFAQRSE